MPNSTTPASRAARIAATRRQEQERQAEGWRKVTLWLPPATIARLNALQTRYDGKGKVVEDAIRLLAENEPEGRN